MQVLLHQLVFDQLLTMCQLKGYNHSSEKEEHGTCHDEAIEML